MGFSLERATGPSAAIKAAKRHGAPTTIDLTELLAEDSSKRSKWVQDRTARKLTATVSGPLREASTLDEVHAALAPVVDRAATPDLVPQDAMVLQPSEERRRSGSHYTPRDSPNRSCVRPSNQSWRASARNKTLRPLRRSLT